MSRRNQSRRCHRIPQEPWRIIPPGHQESPRCREIHLALHQRRPQERCCQRNFHQERWQVQGRQGQGCTKEEEEEEGREEEEAKEEKGQEKAKEEGQEKAKEEGNQEKSWQEKGRQEKGDQEEKGNQEKGQVQEKVN